MFCTDPRLQPFHPLFISCNEPVNQNTWCAKCDKCAFMFLLLSSWLPSSVVVGTIFNNVNMLENESLLPVFEALIGCGSYKPFDCVGTVNEAKAAVHLTALQYNRESRVDETCQALPLPGVLTSLCQACSIEVDHFKCLQDQMSHEEVYKLWKLHEDIK